jgi:hypothetical protein
MVDAGEPCDPTSPGGAFACPVGASCTAACTCGEATTTTTVVGGSTTTTTLPAEICGNCIDDDGDALIDFEDSGCCGDVGTGGMTVTTSVLKQRGARTKMKLRSLLGVDQSLCSIALTHDVFLQMRLRDGQLLCASVPATKFTKRGKHVTFRDRKGRVESAEGIRAMAFVCKADGAVRYHAKGSKVLFRTPDAGVFEITLGLRAPSGDPADNLCHAVLQDFQPAKGGLKTP